MKCRTCNSSNLFEFLDLGHTPPADQFIHASQRSDPVTHYPLVVCQCSDCGLVQLNTTVAPEILFPDDYPYESSTTETGTRHFHEFARSISKRYKLAQDDLAIDIGSNVGVLLEGFQKQGLRVLGIDPAANIVEKALERDIPTLKAFFSASVAEKIITEQGKASAITISNVFAHIHDLNGLMQGVHRLLKEDGVFVIEAPHLLSLIQRLEYDTVYHEHLLYLSVTPLISFFNRYSMEIVNIEKQAIHGGTLRISIRHSGVQTPDPSVQNMIETEARARLHETDTLVEFARRVEENRSKLRGLLCKIKQQGEKVVGLSAPAKGMTLLNYCNIGRETLDYVTEKAPLKIGRYTPGAQIPVVEDAMLLTDKPDYALLLAWNFEKEIVDNNREYLLNGGKIIVPIPEPRIIDKETLQ